MRVLFFGDVHTRIERFINEVNASKADVTFQIGDLGFYTTKAEAEYDVMAWKHNGERIQNELLPAYLAGELPKIKNSAFYIKGNHDNFSDFIKGPTSIGLKYLANGGNMAIGDITVWALGGIFSSIKYKWSAETIERHGDIRTKRFYCEEQVNYIIDNANEGDILITHEAPRQTLPGKGMEGSVPIRMMMDIIKPSYLFHGHHHRYYEKQDNGTIVVGLGPIEYSHPYTYIIDI